MSMKNQNRLGAVLCALPVLLLTHTSVLAQNNPTLAERSSQSLQAIDHRAFYFTLSENDYRSRLTEMDKVKLEIDELVTPRVFSTQKWPHSSETDLEKAFRRTQLERAQLEVALMIAERRARDELLATPQIVEQRAKEIYLQTDAPLTRRNMLVDFQQITFDIAARSLEENTNRVKLARQMIASGAAFEDVVKKYSDDTNTAETGGIIRDMNGATMDVALSKLLIDTLKPGEVASEVITTRRGLHIVKLLRIQPPQKKPFAEVKSALEVRVIEEAGKAARAALLRQINSEQTKFNETAIDAMLVKIDPRAIELARQKSLQAVPQKSK
jgi:hypothetical protein